MVSEVRHTLWGAGSQRPVCICSPCGVPLAPPPTPRTAVQSGRSAGPQAGGTRDSLEEPGDVLAAAAGPSEGHGVVQELWRHDERPFPNGLAVIAASVVLNAEAA